MKTPSLSPRRVVVAEAFADNGLAVLREAGIVIDSQVGKDRASLLASLKDADGLIVRSETRVDAELLAAGPNLAVVARAGVGVDSIDIPTATLAGIVVLNVPAANTLAATEQTFALMLASVRKVVPAANSLRDGIWDRKPYIGSELNGKNAWYHWAWPYRRQRCRAREGIRHEACRGRSVHYERACGIVRCDVTFA